MLNYSSTLKKEKMNGHFHLLNFSHFLSTVEKVIIMLNIRKLVTIFLY